MTSLPWSTDAAQRRRRSTRKRIVDPLPRLVLEQLVSDIPGPRNETSEARRARFAAQMAELLSYKPRNGAEAMLATQCIIARLLNKDARKVMKRAVAGTGLEQRVALWAEQLDTMFENTRQMLSRQQAKPLGTIDAAVFASLGIEPPLIPDPDDPDMIEEAVSGVIVPLHPAPKMLQ